MSIGPFLKRELTTSARGTRAFGDRRVAAMLSGSILVGALLICDYQGWDRSSPLGTQRLGLATFGMMVLGMVLLAMGVVISQVASAIASERDRKTLDALLASPFSSFEVVAGAVAVGMFRFANSAASTLPVVVLVVFLVGVPLPWAVLAGLGLASTALMLAGFSVAASVGARTANRAVTMASGLFGAWLALPCLFILLRPLAWPGAPGWLTLIAFRLSDGSPIGLLMKLLGLLPRTGGAVEAVGLMVGWQVLGALALVAWSAARLRPASRSLYDVEGERGRIRRLKAALRRPPKRPACWDDPVLWYEVHASRGLGVVRRIAYRALGWSWIVAVALGAWWLAAPAFAELARRGYGPSPEAFSMPEMHPLMRLLVRIRMPSLAMDAGPGQARLEFNMVLRVFTGLYFLTLTAASFSGTFEAMKAERRRDTWLGLLATPLSAREILRAKALGTLWRVREVVSTLVALWAVGLVSGAVHPFGFLAATGFLAISGAFFANLGLLAALLECDEETRGRSSFSLVHAPLLVMGSIFLTVGPMALGWASLFTYEDVDAAIRSAPFPEPIGPLGDLIGARGLIFSWLLATGALAIWAFLLGRSIERRFDAAVGRPVRAEPKLESGSATPRTVNLIE